MIKNVVGLYVTYSLFLWDFDETWICFKYIFGKSSNMKFHENLSSGSRVVPCGQTDGWMDMTKLIGAFCTVVNAPYKRFEERFGYPPKANE